MSDRPVCFIHVGTHKTGTTSVQSVLAENAAELSAAGLYIPRAGSVGSSGGHHNLAWELNGDRRFEAARGTFAEALAELAERSAPRACLSSEDFEYLHGKPEALRTISAGLGAIGYEAVVVAYLRPQADYAESLYAELVRHGLTDPFESYLAAILEAGEFRFNDRWRFTFDYERMLDDFARAFGAHHIIARRYESHGGDVVGDFLRIVGGPPGVLRRTSSARRLNAGLRFGEVLRRLECNARSPQQTLGVAARCARDVRGRFDPVHVREVRRIVGRFNSANRRVHQKYGALVPCVSGRDLVGDLAVAAGLDPAGSYRKLVVETHGRAHGLAPRAVNAGRPRAPSIDRERLGFAAQLRQPASLETAIFITATIVALATFVYGSRTASTALVEFGMLSVIVAASAIALLARYWFESRGIVVDDPYFDDLGARLSLVGYAVVGAYALVNALLDLEVPRYQPDWISYPGTIAAAAASLIMTLIIPARRRLIGGIAGPRKGEDLQQDRWYLACSYAVLLGQLAHAVSPVWWMDTTVDMLVVALAAFTVYRIRRAGGVLATTGS